uniref:Ig-like domain-containing protein n=1 Tax=Xenopus tropicalis TaxID=8364 RepID=A0A803J8T5_XENTR
MLVLLFGILLTTVTGDSGDSPNHNGKGDGIRHTDPELRVSPDLITEGSHISLTCHSHSLPKDTLEFALYRDGFKLYNFSKDNTWHIDSFKKEYSGDYTCAVNSTTSPKEIKKSEAVNIQIKEPIPKPEIRVSPKVITDGSRWSISCHYTPTPPGESPGLQFALYRDGTVIEGFSSASEWHVSPARAEQSGNYTCAVRRRNYGEEQRSAGVYIFILTAAKGDTVPIPRPETTASPKVITEGSDMSDMFTEGSDMFITPPAAAKEDTAKSNLLLSVGLPLLAILVVIIMVVALCKLRQKAGHTIPPSHQSNADLPLTKTPAIAVNEDTASSEDPPHPGAPSAGQDVCYTYIDINHLKKTSPAPPATPADNVSIITTLTCIFDFYKKGTQDQNLTLMPPYTCLNGTQDKGWIGGWGKPTMCPSPLTPQDYSITECRKHLYYWGSHITHSHANQNNPYCLTGGH